MRIPHTYRDKYGTYYVRYVIQSNLRKHLPLIARDVRRSLRTKLPSTAKIRSRIFLSALDQVLEGFELGNYRDVDYYMNLITTFDPFGNQVAIERKDPIEEAKVFAELQRIWAETPEGREMMEARKAAYKADRLLYDRKRQKDDHSVAEVIDAFLRDKRAKLSEQSLKELRSGLELFRCHIPHGYKGAC